MTEAFVVTSTPYNDKCLNCGQLATAKFCSHCGQRTGNVHLSFRTLMAQAFDAFFNLDGNLFRSLKLLILKPGQLTLEYWAGRQASYLRPFNLYVASSFLFFVSVGTTLDRPFIGVGPHKLVLLELTPEANQDSADAGASPSQKRPDPPFAISSDDSENPEQKQRRIAESGPNNDDKADAFFEARYAALNAKYKGDANRGLSELFIRVLPNAVILLLPMLALLLKLAYRRQAFVLSEHLIFSAHLQSVALLSHLPLVLWPQPLLLGLTETLFGTYAFLSLKRAYRQGIVKTAVKGMLLAFAYGFVLLFAASLVLIGVWLAA